MIKPEAWIEKCDAILAAGGLTPHERDFLIGVRNRKAKSVAKPRRWREGVLTPEMYAWFSEIERRVAKAG